MLMATYVKDILCAIRLTNVQETEREEELRLSMDGKTLLAVVGLLACLHVVGVSASTPTPSGR